MNEYVIFNAVVFAVLLLISKFIVWLAKKLGKDLSLYKVFGMVDVLWGVAILIFEPGVILFLIGDIVLYRKQI